MRGATFGNPPIIEPTSLTDRGTAGERRGLGSKAIWRRPEGGRWWAHHQALVDLRQERFDVRVGPAAPGEDEG